MKSNPFLDSSDAVSDTFIVDMKYPIGYDRDTGKELNKIFIVVKRNTNKISTGFPVE
ncbi:hypothetical protein [Kosakonia sp. WA-90]|uniref:hypothetical protein n=1 Tax=Kosakonia sp. WA-90 TaxID=3153576 RepID=UPI00325DA81A